MDYKRIYNEIIENRRNNPIVGYGEKHHIIPKSLKGSDDYDNIVKLSAREHFICHLLLTKIHKNTQQYFAVVRAFVMMLWCKSDNQDRYVSSREYEHLKKEFSKIQSQLTGNKNSQYGSRWIHNPSTTHSTKIPKGGLIPEGYILGRTINGIIKRKPKSSKQLQEKYARLEELRLMRINAKVEKDITRNAKIAEEIRMKVLYKENKIHTLYEYHDIYIKVGFDKFVELTNYKYTKQNLVQNFAAHVLDFIPQNGKSRI